MRQCSQFNLCELDDGSDRERVHSGIKQVDQDLNLLQSFQMKTQVKSGVNRETCCPRLQPKEYVGRKDVKAQE